LSKQPVPLELRELDLFRKHNKAINSYEPHPYPGPVILFRGPVGTDWPYNDPELGWKDFARGTLKTVIIPAGHHEFVESVELGAQFAASLKEAQDGINKQTRFSSVAREEMAKAGNNVRG
jgi:hypothetical protein